MTLSATTERIPLPRARGPIVLSFDALSRRIRLVPSKKDSVAALAAQVIKHAGVLCPQIAVKGAAVEMRCRSARIEVQITPQGKDTYLDINELRGLPWRAGPDAAPSFFYDPWRAGLGQSCPGKSPAVRAECELRDGDQLAAAIQLRAALETTARQFACVRLGDLAVATGDPITAAGWYRRAGAFGPFGRIADMRLCELDGRCLQSTEQVLHTFDAAGLPEPLRAESLLRGARAEAYAGRLPSAMHIIAKEVHAKGVSSVCREGGELLCRRILLEAMRGAQAAFAPLLAGAKRDENPATPQGGTRGPPLEQDERAYLEELLETYLAIPSWEKGPFAVEMVQSAAPLAARLGAPAFAGNLLASLAPEVPDAQLGEHLLLAAQAFIGGKDWARAQLVAVYAQSRLGNKGAPTGKGGAGNVWQSPGWKAVFRALAWHAQQDDVSSADRAAIEAELTATRGELASARETLDKAKNVLKAARDTRSSRARTATGQGDPVSTSADKAPAQAKAAAPVAKNVEAQE